MTIEQERFALEDDEFRRLRLTLRHASRRLSADQVVILADDLHAVRRRRRRDPFAENPVFAEGRA